MQIHGRTILNFPFGDSEKEQHVCDFCVEEDSHEFVIDIEDFPIEKAFEFLCDNKPISKEYLFCIDEGGKAFTLYDCYISPLQIPVKQMHIIWNKWLWGYHIQNWKDEKVTFAEYIVQTDKKQCPFHLFVGKQEFDILNGVAHICIDWNQVDSKFEGVVIKASLKQSMTIDMVEKIVLRLLEISFLQTGFFPKIQKRSMTSEDDKVFCFGEDFVAYGKTAKRNIKIDYALNAKSNLNFCEVYNNWWDLREKEVITFNLFSYLTTENSPVRELPIATCIQCFEGYFRIHHSQEMLKYSNSVKRRIRREIAALIEKSDELKVICEENEIEFKTVKGSLDALTGHINEYSLKDILYYAIDRCDAAKKLFEYEQKTTVKNDMTIMDLFIRKAAGHRNWLSHLTEQKNRFVGEEINLANDKLRLLFRLTLLYDIGLEISDLSLDSVIGKINRWYEKNEIY